VLIADAHLPGAIREACAGCGVWVVAPALSAAACLEVAAGLEAIDPALLVPVYAREPDAVTLWKRRA
jgi:NhaP-type Na+/H+ or K+/H+ antiporter